MNKPLKLYKISQWENHNYDSYDSAVVAAYSANGARSIHPSGNNSSTGYDWVIDLSQVFVCFLGDAMIDIEPNTVIVASFNAG